MYPREYDDYSIIPIMHKDKRPDWRLLPQEWDPIDRNHKPAWKPFQSRRATLEERTKWFSTPHNLAVIGGKISNNLAIIDFDNPSAYDCWAAEHPDYPTVKTAQGFHVWVRYGQNKVPPNTEIALADAPGVKVGEIRGEGGYAVAPPSTHASGCSYEWLQGSPLNLPTIPHFQSLGIVKKIEKSKRKPEPSLPANDSLVQTIFRRALQMAGQGNRNDTGFWLACQLRDNGVLLGKAEQVLVQYQQSVVQGEKLYTKREALATVRSAYRNGAIRSSWSVRRHMRNPTELLDEFLMTFGV